MDYKIVLFIIYAVVLVVGMHVLYYKSNQKDAELWDEVYEKVLAERILEYRRTHKEKA